MAWKAPSQVASQAIRIVVLIVFARFLSPSDYGLAGMALTFAALGGIFLDPGFAAALVQRRTLRPIEVSTVHWAASGIGVLLAAIGLAVSPAIASFYGEPGVLPIFAALSLGFAVGGLGVAPTALMTRAQAFRNLEIARMSGVVAGSAAGIAVAIAGGGAWAIVTQSLAGSVVNTSCVWLLSAPRPRGGFSRQTFRELGRFGAHLLGARLLVYVNRTGDNLLVGRVLGTKALGFYSMAYNVILVPFANILEPVRQVLFPIFAQLQDELDRLASIWLRVNRAFMAFFAPAMLGLVVVAPDLIPTLLGERWEPIVPAARLFALVALLQSLLPLNSLVLTVLDRTRTVFRLAALGAVLSVAGFVAGLPWGITGVAAGYLAANLVYVPAYVVVTSRALSLPPVSVLTAVRGAVEAALGMALVTAVARLGLIEAGLDTALRLPLEIALGVLLYAALAAWRTRDLAAEIRLFWAIARGREAPVSASLSVPTRPTEGDQSDAGTDA